MSFTVQIQYNHRGQSSLFLQLYSSIHYSRVQYDQMTIRMEDESTFPPESQTHVNRTGYNRPQKFCFADEPLKNNNCE